MSKDSADSQMEVLHVVFPFDKLSREGKLVAQGLCCLVGTYGFCWWQGWHVHFFFNGEDKRQEQGECNDNKCSDNKCPAGRVRAVRLRPNRATPAHFNITELDCPSINDGGATGQSGETGL